MHCDERSLIVEQCFDDDEAPTDWYTVFRALRMPAGFRSSNNVVREVRVIDVELKVVVRVEPYVSYKRTREA